MKRYIPGWLLSRWTVVDGCSLAVGSMAAALIGWMFYRHITAVILLLPFGFICIPYVRAALARRRRALLQLDFSRFLQSLISALHAGHSLESAFREIEQDMRRESRSENNHLLPGLVKLNQRVALGESIDKALTEISREWELEDLHVFAESLAVFRRAGGNLLLHLRRTGELIIEKLETEREVQVILAQKQTEAFMMNLAPYMMIALILLSSPEYAEPLYSGIGRAVMTAALALIGTGHVWSLRMLGRNQT